MRELASNAARSFLMMGLLLFAITSSDAYAQKGTWRENVGLVMRSVEDLNQKGQGRTSIGVQDANSAEWTASFYTGHEFYAGHDRSRCSATLIGPTTLLLAAQCIPDGGEVVIEFRGLRQPGACEHAESFLGNSGVRAEIFALCLLKSPITGIQFDTVNRTSARIEKGTRVLVSSFSSCPSLPVERATDARFRISEGVVVALAEERLEDPNSIVVRGNAVCPGDVGGIAYILLPSKRRLVLGVYFGGEKAGTNISSLSTKDGQAFLKQWTERMNASICGVNYDGSNCR
jgi:hypothetical protein